MTPAQIKNRIDALEFAQTELMLYLDVHPMDGAARNQWERNAAELESLQYQYTQLTGAVWPMRQNHQGGASAWVSSPWPWDNM